MSKERRRYYRIEDVVSLSYQTIAAAEQDAYLEKFWSDEHTLTQRREHNLQIELHNADRQAIAKKMPELARYLDVLQQQIDQLSETINGAANNQAQQLTPSSLSAQGISFMGNQAPVVGELVELTLKLLPSGLSLVIIARVVTLETCDQQSGKFKISLDFEHLQDSDREILIKHMHGKQMEALSSAREA